MKIFRIFTIAAAALMMAACSTDDIAQLINGDKKNFTATLAAPGSGGTRTILKEDNNKITVKWAEGDEIALVHNGVKDVATVKSVDATTGKATITGTLTGTVNNNDPVKLIYPAAYVSGVNSSDGDPIYDDSKLLTQGGTLDYIQKNLDFRQATGQLSVNGSEVTLNSAVKLESGIAIWKLTLKQQVEEQPVALEATQVKIMGGTKDLASTATLATATSEVTLAMPTNLSVVGTLTIEATVGEDTYTYTKTEGVTFAANTYYQNEVTLTKQAATDLSKLTGDYTAKNGETLTGTLDAKVKISIADGATVTLAGVTINGNGIGDQQCEWAGINCLGDATIILKDGSTNTVTGFNWSCPGIYVPKNKTLTIKGETAGTGKLTASSCKQGNGAGIGGGMFIDCGNIEIQGGVITAYGGDDAAGIGSANYSSCGSITISGGTVNATSDNDGAGIGSGNAGTCTTITISGGTVVANSGDRGAGIGSGFQGTCGNISISGGTVEATGGANAAGIGTGQYGTCVDITITTGVTKVTATKGSDSPNSIGAGKDGTCGTVTIGCTLNNDGNPVGGTTGAISTSPYTYDPSAPAAWAANEYNEASWDGTKVVLTKKSATNPTAVTSSTSGTWGDGWYTVSGNVTINGDVLLTNDVHLILQDGATLTINGQLDCRTNSKNLYIYGQDKGDGKLNVSYSDDMNGTAIYGAWETILEIHGGEITAAAIGVSGMGLEIDHFKMYGGKLTSTSKNNPGILFTRDFEVYGGEVVGTTNSTLYPSNGINGINGVLTVYGGKVTATGNGINDTEYDAYGSGFGCKVQSGTTGIKFYFSDDGTTWGDGTSYDSATSVGSYDSDAATRKRYAKAE